MTTGCCFRPHRAQDTRYPARPVWLKGRSGNIARKGPELRFRLISFPVRKRDIESIQGLVWAQPVRNLIHPACPGSTQGTTDQTPDCRVLADLTSISVKGRVAAVTLPDRPGPAVSRFIPLSTPTSERTSHGDLLSRVSFRVTFRLLWWILSRHFQVVFGQDLQLSEFEFLIGRPVQTVNQSKSSPIGARPRFVT